MVEQIQIKYIFTFVSNQFVEGGGSPDPKVNKRLADAIDQAKSSQVPLENIQRVLTAAKVVKIRNMQCLNT